MKDQLSSKRRIPFGFALEELNSLSPMLKPMFGGFIVYIGEKMTLFLYDQEKWVDFKGASLATTPEHYHSLAQEFSSTRNAEPQKIGKSPWLLIPASSADFEKQLLKACELILKGDPRIGREPKPTKARPTVNKRSVKRKSKSN